MDHRMRLVGHLDETRIAGLFNRHGAGRGGGGGGRGQGRGERGDGGGDRGQGRGERGDGRGERGQVELQQRFSDPVDVGNLRIRAKPGFRAVVQELEDGQLLVSEIPDAPELGAVALAPALATAALRKLKDGAKNLNLQDRLKAVIRRVREGRGGDADAVLRLPGPIEIGCAGGDCGCGQ